MQLCLPDAMQRHDARCFLVMAVAAIASGASFLWLSHQSQWTGFLPQHSVPSSPVLGGQLADKYGGKRVLAAGVLLWSLFTALTPEAAALGTAPLLAARVLLGVGEGIAFPAIHSMIARNVPPASAWPV
eukprot:scaffold318779_cov14-Tisochrysis_lutea.AAC.1